MFLIGMLKGHSKLYEKSFYENVSGNSFRLNSKQSHNAMHIQGNRMSFLAIIMVIIIMIIIIIMSPWPGNTEFMSSGG